MALNLTRPTLGATSLLNRKSDLRHDRDQVEALLSEANTRFFVIAGGKLVVDSNADRSESAIRWFSRADLDTMGVPMMDTLYLGEDDDSNAAQFAVIITDHFARHAPDAGDRLMPTVDLRSLASQGAMSSEQLGLAAQAIGLRNWHEASRCCGRCGGSMSMKNGGWKRRCWACKNEVFPRVDPVVIMAVTHGDKLLLAHEERFPDTMYSTIAGFIEPGDDIAHAVRRETMEEVGVEVGDVVYCDSQPWPFPHSLMIGCMARATTDAITINPREVDDAKWFSRDDIAKMLDRTHPDGLWVPGAQSMANTLIRHYLDETA